MQKIYLYFQCQIFIQYDLLISNFLTQEKSITFKRRALVQKRFKRYVHKQPNWSQTEM